MEIKMLGFNRITFDPEVMGGRACIRGMRITVALVLNLVANDMSIKEIAQILGKSNINIKVMLFRARNNMAKVLANKI